MLGLTLNIDYKLFIIVLKQFNRQYSYFAFYDDKECFDTSTTVSESIFCRLKEFYGLEKSPWYV